MRPKVSTAEQVIARLAGRAHGVVTREELLRAGLTADEIKRRVRSGALIRVHRGVYRVGHTAPSVEAWYLAASGTTPRPRRSTASWRAIPTPPASRTCAPSFTATRTSF